MSVLLNYFDSHLSLMEKHFLSPSMFKEDITHLKAIMLHIIVVKIQLLGIYDGTVKVMWNKQNKERVL